MAFAFEGTFQRIEGSRLLALTLSPSVIKGRIDWTLESKYSGAFYQPSGILDEGCGLREESDALVFTSRFGQHRFAFVDQHTLLETNVRAGGAAVDAAIEYISGGKNEASFRWRRVHHLMKYELFVDESGLGRGITRQSFTSDQAALEAAGSRWCCWVLYRTGTGTPTEIAHGGYGVAAQVNRVRRHATQSLPSYRLVEPPLDALRRKAEQLVDDERMVEPLRDAVQKVEGLVEETSQQPPLSPTPPSWPVPVETVEAVDDEAPSSGSSRTFLQQLGSIGNGVLAFPKAAATEVIAFGSEIVTPLDRSTSKERLQASDEGASSSEATELIDLRNISLRELFAVALTGDDDEQCAKALVRVAKVTLSQVALDGTDSPPTNANNTTHGGSADELISRLSECLMECAPTDGEMRRLRLLQDTYYLGPYGYAIACCWAAALFARTELCINARSRLTERLLRMGRTKLKAVQDDCNALLGTELPTLLTRFSEAKSSCVDRLRKEVAVQEVSVRASKAVASGLSIAGSVTVFTPAAPVGVGLLVAGGGLGVIAAGGDAMGTHWQKQEMSELLNELSESEGRVQTGLRDLLANHFGDVPLADWEAARGAGIDFQLLEEDEEEVDASLALTTAGLALLTPVLARALGIVGATISAADFAISCFTNSPNSEALERLTAFLEARAQTYRVWRVLLEQFVSLETDQVEDEEDDAPATAVERDAVGLRSPREQSLTQDLRAGLVKAFTSSPLEKEVRVD